MKKYHWTSTVFHVKTQSMPTSIKVISSQRMSTRFRREDTIDTNYIKVISSQRMSTYQFSTTVRPAVDHFSAVLAEAKLDGLHNLLRHDRDVQQILQIIKSN